MTTNFDTPLKQQTVAKGIAFATESTGGKTVSEQWDKPSDTLRRIATATQPPYLRECGECLHRHAKGDRCGYPTNRSPLRTCACAS